MRIVTIRLNDREQLAVQEHVVMAGLTEEQLFKLALKYYDLIKKREWNDGDRMAFIDRNGNLINEPVFGCMGDE